MSTKGNSNDGAALLVVEVQDDSVLRKRGFTKMMTGDHIDSVQSNIEQSLSSYGKSLQSAFNIIRLEWKTLSSRQSKLCDIKAELDSDASRIENKKKKCDLTTPLKKPRQHGRNILKLNIGGKKVDIKRQTIATTARGWNLLSVLLSGRWDHLLQKDSNGCIFFDLDYQWLEPIINSFREQNLRSGKDAPTAPLVTRGCQLGFHTALTCYRMEGLFRKDLDAPSTIGYMNDPAATYHLKSFLRPCMSGPVTAFKLIYRGSRDGFKAADFHSRCDGQPNTVCIVEDVKGNIFGGFADVAWRSLVSNKQAQPQAAVSQTNKLTQVNAESDACRSSNGNIGFLFSLYCTNDTGCAVKLPINKNFANAFVRDRSKLCTFGCTTIPTGLTGLGTVVHDLYIASDCNINSDSYTHVGLTYSRGGGGAHRMSGGSMKFQVRELEVYAVMDAKSQGELKASTTPSDVEVVSEVFNTQSVQQETQAPGFVSLIKASMSELSPLQSTVENYTQQLLEYRREVQHAEELFLQELRFVIKLVNSESALEALRSFKCAFSSDKSMSPDLGDWELITMIEECVSELRGIAEKRGVVEQDDEDALSEKVEEEEVADSVVSFNVGGTVVSTLRSTLRLAAPESFLARRVSGRWTEQDSDLDEDGNIFQDVHPGCFQRIMAYLRLRMLLGEDPKNKIFVSEEEASSMEMLLSFYGISEVPVEVMKDPF